MSAMRAGDVVAIYHYKEGEIEKGPAIVGGSALLAATEGQFRVRPCGYRYLSCNHPMRRPDRHGPT